MQAANTSNTGTTKEKIVKTALRLFLQKGFYHVSLQDVATVVGISKPAIYHHFKNKDEMIEAVLDYFSDTMKTWAMEYYSDSKNDLKLFVQKSFQAIYIFKNVENLLLEDESPEGVFLYTYNEFLMTIAKHSERFRERISVGGTATRKAYSAFFAKGQEQGIVNNKFSPEKLGMMLHSLIEGLSFIAEIDASIDLKAESEKQFEQFWALISC